MKIPKDVAQFMHFGWTSVVILTAGVLGGRLLDSKFGTSPKILLALVLISLMATAYLFYSMVKKLNKK